MLNFMKYMWWSKSQLSWGMVLICHLNILEFCEKHLISITMYSRKKECLEVFIYELSGEHIGSCSFCKLLWQVCQDG